MELIRDVIEWVGNELGTTLATLFPFLMLGLLGLYVLWMLVGYLRVSQIGLGDGREVRQAMPLPTRAEGADRPRGVPYCSFDDLAFPIGARFCTSCERDLFIDCATCGATVSAADASCYRCGTPTGAVAGAALLG